MKTNKPNWNDAPDWAYYLAMDENGTWCWYGDMPEIDFENNMWNTVAKFCEIFNESIEWKDSLESRPN